MLRKHIKVEPAQYYADADRLGILIWQDMPSGAFGDQAVRRSSTQEATMSSAAMAEYQSELSRIIGALRSFPSIVMWVTNNEGRSEEHTSELQSLMRISYAVFCLKKKKIQNKQQNYKQTHARRK